MVHQEVNRALDKLQKRHYWPLTRNDVKNWCRQCETFAASRCPLNKKSGQNAPVERRGPFLKDNHWCNKVRPTEWPINRYLLIAMECFTKWPEAYATPTQYAWTVAEALVTSSEYRGSYTVTRAVTTSSVWCRRFCNTWERARRACSGNRDENWCTGKEGETDCHIKSAALGKETSRGKPTSYSGRITVRKEQSDIYTRC